jgi:hypothetical protein
MLVLGRFHGHPYEEVAMNSVIDYVAHRSLELPNRVMVAPVSGAFVILVGPS